MKININSVHFKSDKKLDQFIIEKIEKLTGNYDGIIGGDVKLKLEKSEALENKVAEIRLQIRGSDLFAKKQSKTFEEATLEAVEALKKQLIKHKDKSRE
ncbi:MAG: HPF/RaiA family ribosome-associated protein [Lentimicrobiaceae bacterium]|jgi:putative sigma-54 modulation protein|nr:HPF/RaiA family ribosome-associated protein [Lentimicrobiaceae bacterium]